MKDKTKDLPPTSLPPHFKPQWEQLLCADAHGLRKLWKKIMQREREHLPAERDKALFSTRYQKSHAQFLARQSALPTPKLNQNLPVLAHQSALLEAISKHQVVIISGETGSGKTTQLPQLCLKLGLGAKGMIAHTQPRRIAARSVASRIAEELDCVLGEEVGYQVRFDEKYNENTIIKLMTDGMLLAETLHDPYLSKYEVIIVDEAHERSLNIDFLLGYLHRLLPKRPDLKVIITSATIDSDLFAKHFNAPSFSVSGRSYPVEIRYREPLPDEDLPEQIQSALLELEREGQGDVLVFLPTEREIRETLSYLQKQQQLNHQSLQAEIVPLFGRLSLAEQQAVFHPKAKKRIVLSTNVAETSLTVPRIKYVIDTGTARISRYSLRTKTQRLPIEAISQAAANQRAGRCGRLSAGICIRLYSEEDFKSRAEFTEPEILRTNLAAVILQMLALQLGDVGNFPFVEPPDERLINDGYRLLFELKAVNEKNELSALGRKMASLPIDPRFARIVFEAERKGCLQEALIVLAALSLQDPRERPFGQEAVADQRQGEFQDPNSDFQTLLNLFFRYQHERHALSNKALRAWCNRYFLHEGRMREWRELVNQLLRDCRERKLAINDLGTHEWLDKPEGSKGRFGLVNPSLESLHRALLSGFLDQVGLWDEQSQSYLGTRNRRFRLFPASALAKKKLSSVMAAQIVETSQVFARVCAPIVLADLEQLASHLTKTQYRNPHWSKKAGNVMAEETVLLYGLPLVSGRQKPFFKQDKALSHRIFVEEALVTGELNTRLSVIKQNLALREKLEDFEDRLRNRSILLDEQTIAAFYYQRLDESVHSVVSLEQWAKEHGESALRMQESDLLQENATTSHEGYPDYLSLHGQQFALSYHFEPGAVDDGVTVIVPLTALNVLQERDLERLVPAMFVGKLEAMLRALPKVWRRQFVPIPDYAKALGERLAEMKDAPLDEQLSAAIFAMRGIKIPVETWAELNLDPHCRMNIRLMEGGKVVAEGRDLSALQQQFSSRASESFQARSQSALVTGDVVNDWAWEHLPMQEKMKGGMLGYPALTLESDGQLRLRLHDDPERAKQHHALGVLHLFRLKLSPEINYLRKQLPNMSRLALYYQKIIKSVGGAQQGHLLDDLVAASIKALCLQHEVPRSKLSYQSALALLKKELVRNVTQLSKQLEALLASYSEVNERLRGVKYAPAREDIERQIGRLVYVGFIQSTEPKRFVDLTRYMQALLKRLDKMKLDPMKDARWQEQILPYEQALQSALAQAKIVHIGQVSSERGFQGARGEALVSYFWLLEEWRVQCFAQELGTAVKVSSKRLDECFSVLKG
ncbi:MAG: ATP-dependent RNA helicase HrpA [Cardiobacteriaceae bacterium]|nr:ATP-dependent RNA helicase HrpA [Cardiobacteriaceae bacterium]